MPVSKRLRFEVLRRDGFACRYCGAKAPDVRLVVDHVIPESLGGKTEAGNLVAACDDCNSGKASTHPDDQVVEDVTAATIEWKVAMELAVEELAGDASRRAALLDRFDQKWLSWGVGVGGEGAKMRRPGDWAKSVEAFLAAGLTIEKLEELVDVAMNAKKIVDDKVWRYFCGCAWRTVDDLHERATEILAE